MVYATCEINESVTSRTVSVSEREKTEESPSHGETNRIDTAAIKKLPSEEQAKKNRRSPNLLMKKAEKSRRSPNLSTRAIQLSQSYEEGQKKLKEK